MAIYNYDIMEDNRKVTTTLDTDKFTVTITRDLTLRDVEEYAEYDEMNWKSTEGTELEFKKLDFTLGWNNIFDQMKKKKLTKAKVLYIYEGKTGNTRVQVNAFRPMLVGQREPAVKAFVKYWLDSFGCEISD